MVKVLYFGNKLGKKGFNPTSVYILVNQLTELFEVKRFSDRKNQLFRLIHMIYGLCVNRKWADCVLLDTCSSTAFYFAIIIGFLSKKLNIKYIPILHGGNLEYRLINHPKKSKYFFGNAYKLVAPSGFIKS